MSVKNTYKSNSNFLKAEDLKGLKIRCIISATECDDFFKEGKENIALTFQGKEKKLLLNKTNANAIASSYGDEETEWVDKEILMFPSTTEYNGKTVPCIRVMIDKPEAKDEDIAF